MAIVTEDGTGLATAESYISVADADTRHAALGNTTWAALTDAAKEILLRKATEYMVQTYRGRIKGSRRLATQALDMPRTGMTIDGYAADYDEVPAPWENACADLALKANSATLLADQTQGVVKEKLGPIETEYDVNSRRDKQYAAIDRMLSPYLKGSGNQIPLLRG